MPSKSVTQRLREELEELRQALAQEENKSRQLVQAVERYRETNRALQDRMETVQDLMNQTQERLLRVVDQVVDLKREGFTAPFASRENLEKLDIGLDDSILGAIEQRAEPQSQLWRQLVRGAMARVRTGTDISAVRSEILNGGSPPDQGEG
jgi:hypothetical protein